eukprot:Em0002g1708a
MLTVNRPVAAIARILAIIQESGPPLGLNINIAKCELFSSRDLSSFPEEMRRSNVPHFGILGAPIGDLVFCAKFVAQKQLEASKLLKELEAVGSINPQVALLLLRQSSMTSRPRIPEHPSVLISKDTATNKLDLPDEKISDKREQSPMDSSVSFSAETENMRMERLLGSLCHNNLFHNASVTDRARLLSISSPHASAWLSVTSSPRLNLHLEPAEFQVALKWWLGIPVVQGQSCPHCPSCVLDDFGHHSLTCKHGGDVVSRHNKLRDVFYDFCQRACLGPRLEMGCGAGSDSQSRPADVLVPNWDLGKPAAFDLSVTSTLQSSALLEASVTAGSAALLSENRKHNNSDKKCDELGWARIPLVVAVAGRLSVRNNELKSKTIFSLYSHLGLTLVRANCRAILSRLT